MFEDCFKGVWVINQWLGQGSGLRKWLEPSTVIAIGFTAQPVALRFEKKKKTSYMTRPGSERFSHQTFSRVDVWQGYITETILVSNVDIQCSPFTFDEDGIRKIWSMFSRLIVSFTTPIAICRNSILGTSSLRTLASLWDSHDNPLHMRLRMVQLSPTVHLKRKTRASCAQSPFW